MSRDRRFGAPERTYAHARTRWLRDVKFKTRRRFRGSTFPERKHDRVPAFQRFDLDGESDQPVVSDEEMKRRWAAFHYDMHLMSGKRWQRMLGELLGEDTRRYRIARIFGRPILQVFRRLRASRRNEPIKATAQFAREAVPEDRSKTFPLNYSPKTAIRFVNLASYQVPTHDVTTVVVDERMPAPPAISAANEALNETTATWMFLCDTTSTEEERATALLALFNHVGVDDDVVFADEDGANRFTPLFKFSLVPPHTLLSYNLVGRPALLRVATLRRVGGFDAEAGWAFEHDAYLRLVEAHAVFRHVNLVLPAARPELAFDRDHIDDDTCRVTEKALARRGWTCPRRTRPSTSSSRRVTASIWYATASRRSRTRRRIRTGTSSCSTTTRSNRSPLNISRTRSIGSCRVRGRSTTPRSSIAGSTTRAPISSSR